MYAKITLDLYEAGIHFICEDAGVDDFISKGDGNKLMDLLNEVEFVCNPNATFEITEKGKKLLKQNENLV